MKVTHWTIQNGSGMNNVAASMVASECAIGLTSQLANPEKPESYGMAEDSDIHVVHTHFPDVMRKHVTKPLKLVWVAHGTPEHVFQGAVESGHHGGYGAPDSFMVMQFWLQNADAIVTFWPRHQAIYQSLCDKGRTVNLVPLGVDKAMWKPVESRGKFQGTPSVFSSENPHYIKWPLDLLIAWPWIRREIDEAYLHLTYMVLDQQRWFMPLANRNGSAYSAHISNTVFKNEDLRNALCSVDYYVGLVRYGDFNHMALQANACGVKTISYVGNQYADFWLPEGDQRVIADEMVKILKGTVEPRKKAAVPDVAETAEAMRLIYERL